jgi:hypothetical protein
MCNKKRNTVTYILQICMTTMAFVLQVYGGADILFSLDESTDSYRLDWLSFAFQTISVLYIWELIYREKIGVPLLVHHLLTILLIQLSAASFYDTLDVFYLRFGCLMGFYATTEQTSFIILYFYRLKLYPRTHATLFLVACVQSFVFKTAITVVGMVYYVYIIMNGDIEGQRTNWNWFWSVCFFPLLALLYGAQLYACKILWDLHLKCKRPIARPTAADSAKETDTIQESSTSQNSKKTEMEVEAAPDSGVESPSSRNDTSVRNDIENPVKAESGEDDLNAVHEPDEVVSA